MVQMGFSRGAKAAGVTSPQVHLTCVRQSDGACLRCAGPDIAIEFPKDARVRFIVDSLASYVVSDGCRFEMAAMSAQGSNPEFSFLFDLRSPAHAYYR